MIGAFLIGLFGSLHCVGMCGPIMLSMMNTQKSLRGFFWYHSGRIGTYMLLGTFFGLMGAAISFFHVQQLFAVLLGTALIVLYGVPSLRVRIEKYYYHSPLYRRSKKLLVNNLNSRRKWLISGFANGFFPCGLTYVAAAGAVARGSISEGALFMLVFGLGTIPALLSLSFFSRAILQVNQKLFSNTVSTVALLSGALLIFRGIFLSFPDFKVMVEKQAMSLLTTCGL